MVPGTAQKLPVASIGGALRAGNIADYSSQPLPERQEIRLISSSAIGSCRKVIYQSRTSLIL
jgi:hypothetical protein